MSNVLFLKRVFFSMIYWLSVLAAILLLLCSIIYIDNFTGKEYTFISLFYDEIAMEALEYGQISVENILLGYDTGYLWMFCPIIVGIPCVKLKSNERFVLFRTGKNKYFLSKYLSNILASGSIMFWAYLVYMLICMTLIKENIWNINLAKKLLSVFCWGAVSALPGTIISEFAQNKYLILCIPFVINYFMYSFVVNIIPYDIWEYISPYNYQILFLYDEKKLVSCILVWVALIGCCGVVKRIILEGRCDCGQ